MRYQGLYLYAYLLVFVALFLFVYALCLLPVFFVFPMLAIDHTKVNTIHFRVRIETLNRLAIWLKCFILPSCFNVFARVA